MERQSQADGRTAGLLPLGLTDMFHKEAAVKTRLEQVLQETFRRWGYQRLIVPSFEYYDSLAIGATPPVRAEMYRFFDREGELLALRPDMTVPAARVVGTRLYDQTPPLRLYYIGNVFRYEEPQAGRRREFTQAGIELIGADTAQADAEVIAVAIAALSALDIADFTIDIGQAAFLKAILSETSLTSDELDLLWEAVDRRNDDDLGRVLHRVGLDGEIARAIRALPHLSGDDAVIHEAWALAPNAQAGQALDRLQEVYDLMRVEGMAEHILLDLAKVHTMAYYSGIIFHAYVAGLGTHLCNGGRYDHLIARFSRTGQGMPAMGFALGVERAMLVTRPHVDTTADLLMCGCHHPTCHALATQARAQGLCVEVDVLGRQGEDLVRYGRERGAKRIVACRDDGAYVLIQAGASRVLNRRQLIEEIAAWTN